MKRTEDQEIMYQAIKDAWMENLAIMDIKTAVEDAVNDALSRYDIAKAIEKGIFDSMPYASEISNAIYNGVKNSTIRETDD